MKAVSDAKPPLKIGLTMGMVNGSTAYFTWMLFQGVMIVLCISVIIMMMKQKPNTISRRMLSVAFLGLIYNISYFQEINCANLSEAMVAVVMEVISLTFFNTFLCSFVSGYCNINLQKWMIKILYGIDFVIVISAWCYRWTGIFSTPVCFDRTGLIPHMRMERGPMARVFYALIFIQLIGCVLMAMRSYFRADGNRNRMRYFSVLFLLLFPLLGNVLMAMKWTVSFNPVPATVAIGLFVFMVVTLKCHTFNIAATAHENIVEHLDTAVVIMDHMLGFVEANEKAYTVFPELNGVSKGQRLNSMEQMPLFTNGGVYCQERDGRFYENHINVIKEKETVLGFAILSVDVTESKNQLEHMKRLKESADRANNAKSEFLAKVSHEIRTPINSILGMNEMVLRESDSPKIKEYAGDIRSAAYMLLGLINDVLDTSKIESGKLKINPAKYHLAKLLNTLIQMMKPRAEDKDLCFEVEVAPYLPAELVGDDLRISQVLMNLLSNAIKYTQEGSVRLRVSGDIDRDKVILRFEVEDTGRGVKEEDIPKLFEMYERVNMQYNRGIEGTGLGLPITSRLLRLMGSRLEMDSTYGKGSVFWFDLEQKIVGSERVGNLAERAQNDYEEYRYNKPYTIPDAKILVVDDNRVNLRVFANLVKELNPKLTLVESGRKCLECIEQEHFDLIFLDHMMPGMDGLETMEQMKMSPDNKCKDTPVVMLTANALVGAREIYLENGFAEFLTKPVIPEKLEQMIEALLPKELVKKSEKL